MRPPSIQHTMMKKIAFALIALAALLSPLSARAQQIIATATPTQGAAVTPVFTLFPTLTAIVTTTPTATIDPAVTATPTATLAPTMTETAIAPDTATPAATTDPALAPSQDLTSTQIPPDMLATATPDPLLAAGCSAGATDGKPGCMLSSVAAASTTLFSRASLGPGANPALASAVLIASSGQVIANTSLNPDGTFMFTAAPGDYTLRLSAPGYLTAQRAITLYAGQSNVIADVTLPSGDINADNNIDALDLISLGAAFESAATQMPSADLNGDGVIDLFDLTLLARNWRQSGPISW